MKTYDRNSGIQRPRDMGGREMEPELRTLEERDQGPAWGPRCERGEALWSCSRLNNGPRDRHTRVPAACEYVVTWQGGLAGVIKGLETGSFGWALNRRPRSL